MVGALWGVGSETYDETAPTVSQHVVDLLFAKVSINLLIDSCIGGLEAEEDDVGGVAQGAPHADEDEAFGSFGGSVDHPVAKALGRRSVSCRSVDAGEEDLNMSLLPVPARLAWTSAQPKV